MRGRSALWRGKRPLKSWKRNRLAKVGTGSDSDWVLIHAMVESPRLLPGRYCSRSDSFIVIRGIHFTTFAVITRISALSLKPAVPTTTISPTRMLKSL